MFDIETKLGEIHFPASTINRIVMEAVESCGDKVDILNYKGKYKNMMPWLASRMNIYKEEAGGIRVEETEEGMNPYRVCRHPLWNQHQTGDRKTYRWDL